MSHHWVGIIVLGAMFVIATIFPINMGVLAFVESGSNREFRGGWGCGGS